MTKKLSSWVFPGVAETLASASLLVSMLIIDDLPTLERPMKANSGRFQSGAAWRSRALMLKTADLIFMNGLAGAALSGPRTMGVTAEAGKRDRLRWDCGSWIVDR